ncbi:hypothetical protein [Streptosporangium sp. NPDC001681]|uniref:hypothetical protein n=1 Tax=Streptosporangium sp. NPDC001681 TaxID=3154395 RepID=UPI003317A6B5
MTIQTMQVSLQGSGLIDFNFLVTRAGSKDGARATFEELIQDLVGAKHPEVSTVEANPGDWGIDAYVGSLAEGEVSVWQSKFFIDGFDKSQQSQVREAYDGAVSAAKDENYTLTSWTLCMPCNFDGPNEKWWDGWKKRTEKRDNIVIDLWNKVRLRRLLMSEDAKYIADNYFNPIFSVSVAATKPTVRLDDPFKYEGALFVKQMHIARMLACDDAKEEFFNAEILSREIHDKALEEEVAALNDTRAVLGSLWSQRFNTAVQLSNDQLLPGLYEKVMDAVRDHHPSVPKVLRCGLIHAFGLMHQRVNEGRAGWVRDYRKLVEEYMSSAQPIEDKRDHRQPGDKAAQAEVLKDA